MRLTRQTWRGVFHLIKMFAVAPAAILYRKKKQSVWLITERKNQARDNGYCFFKYIREKHPEQECYYVIEKDVQDASKVARFGNIIAFNSWRHYFYFCLSKVHISAHVGGCVPENSPYTRKIKKTLGYQDVFIPHGVSYGIAEFCIAMYAHIDLYFCCGKYEYENLITNYGYLPSQVAITGFPRMDEWFDLKVKEEQILLMPTWRLYIAQDEKVIFEDTVFYKTYQELINDQQLISFLSQNRLKLVFYLHHEMQKYADSFHTLSKNIEIAYEERKYDIQKLLKESALLITDYSSVHFDFAYMGKPVIYYQFDQKEFYEKQYAQSIFKAEKDGFGPVVYSTHELIDELTKEEAEEFVVPSEYNDRMKRFFLYHDNMNCSRVYEEISKRQ